MIKKIIPKQIKTILLISFSMNKILIALSQKTTLSNLSSIISKTLFSSSHVFPKQLLFLHRMQSCKNTVQETFGVFILNIHYRISISTHMLETIFSFQSQNQHYLLLNSDMDPFLVICLLVLFCSILFGCTLVFIFKCLVGVAECIYYIQHNNVPINV